MKKPDPTDFFVFVSALRFFFFFFDPPHRGPVNGALLSHPFYHQFRDGVAAFFFLSLSFALFGVDLNPQLSLFFDTPPWLFPERTLRFVNCLTP